jgi:hypothetical protein
MKSMSRLVLPVLALGLLLSLSGRPAGATTYMMMSDRALTDQAPVVVDVRVVGADPSPVDGTPATDYLVEVDRVLKGDLPGSTVVVRVPGGVGSAGLGLKIWGSPRFARGESAILFLSPAQDGTYRILHLMLGAFHKRPAAGGAAVALRDLTEAHDLGAKSLAEDGVDAVRDFARFSDWVADRAAGVPNPGRYVVGKARAKLDSLLRTPGLPEKYVLMTAAGDGLPIRWFRFDNGQSVEWKVGSAGQPGLGLDATIGAFQTALDAWNSDPGTNIEYVYTGTTDAANGLVRSDGVNAIIFDDPFRNDPANAVDGTFDCSKGGVIAIGGPFYYTSTRTWKGQRYHEVAEGDIVTNDGTQCLFQNNPSAAQEVFTHELGHTLGLAHSKDRDAVMFPTVHNDGRGAHLAQDDRAAISQLYGDGSVQPPPPPPPATTLAAPDRFTGRATSATAVSLSWRDRAVGETGYVVEAKANIKGATFRTAATLPAGAVGTVVTGLTPGTAYDFRVRAVAGGQSSLYSKAILVTTPKR